MKKVHILFMALIFAAVFSACKQAGDDITYIMSGNPQEENTNFESRAISVIAGTDTDVKGTIYTRIYDGNDYLPYVGLKYWLSEMCDAEVSSISYSGGKYVIMASALGKSFPLEINTAKNTIYCPSWAGFFFPDESLKFGENNIMYYVKKVFTGQKAITFNLGQYGFKIYGGLEDAYIPLCVANQLFTAPMTLSSFLYNGVSLYKYADDSDYKTFRESPWYKDLKKRPPELVDISYRLLCLNHDYIYGKPGYYGFADNNDGYAKEAEVKAADELSFDALLTQKDPETKALLKSPSYADYFKGMRQLTLSTYGDLHAFFPVAAGSFLSFDDKDIEKALEEAKISNKRIFHDKKSGVDDEGNTIDGTLADWRQKKQITKYNLKDSEYVLKDEKKLELIDGGKTLIIRFDSFTIDSSKWQAYYTKSPSALPDPKTVDLPEDSITLFYKAFYNIYHDKEEEEGDYKDVKTVLIDDSCNTGGAVRALEYILNLITGSGDIYYEDVHSSTKYHEIIKVDLNLDGKVDSKDDEFQENFKDLNIAILTSFKSFSCGNALPFFVKERKNSKIKVIGERSGGGSCVVGSGVTADGFPFNFSFYQRLCSSDFSKTNESGAELDYDLTVGTWNSDSINRDYYSKFFDNDELIKALKAVFGDKY